MNKKIRLYTIVSQGIIQTLVLMFLGYKLGTDWWLNSSTYGGVLAVVGGIIGIILLIINTIKVGDVFDKRKDI